MHTIGQWLGKKNNRKPLKTIHNSHIQLYLCHNPSKTGTPVHSANHVGRVVCFSLDLSVYLFLSEDGPGIPVFLFVTWYYPKKSIR